MTVREFLRRAAALLALLGLALPVMAEDEKKPVTYDDHVKPIFRQKCLSCHNTDKKSGGLDLSTYTAMMQGGGSGDVVEPGSSSDSYLFMVVNHDVEPYMPPNSERVADDMLAVLRDWIDGGALENAGSKPRVAAKPKFDLAAGSAGDARPEGPPPMPERLSLEPPVRTERTTAVTALATSPWAPLAAVAGQRQVLLYHTETLELLGVLPFPEGVPHVLKFTRNGALLLAAGGKAGAEGRAVVWDVKTGERVIEVGDEYDAVLAADISVDLTRVAVGGPNRVVRIYSTADGSVLHEIRKHTDWVTTLEFSPDGVLLATGDRAGGLFVWEAHTARQYLELRAHQQAVTDVSWRIDSNLLASCSEEGTIRLWEMENGGQVRNWAAHGGGTQSVEFARDGRILSCGRDRTAKLWDQAGAQQRAFEAFGDIALRATFCDETNRAIAGDWTGAIRVWKADDGVAQGDLTPNPPKLAERLEAAQTLVAEREAAHQAQAEAAKTAEAALAKVRADLDAANKAVADAQSRIDSGNKTAAETKQAMETLAGEIEAADKQAAALEAGVAALKEAQAKGQDAAGKLPEDKELAAAVEVFKARLEATTTGLEAARKLSAEKKTALETAKKQLADAEKQVADATAALDAAQKQVAAMTEAVKPAEEQAAAAKQAAEAAAQALAEARQSVERWQDEIAFAEESARRQEDQARADAGE